jgi:hypothetical protein
VVTLALLISLVAQPAIAQSYQDEGPRYTNSPQKERSSPQSSSPSGSSSNLPNWAEPSQSRDDFSSSAGAGAKAMEPPPPGPPGGGGPPPQVPVDGGLALLAAAGAGYAVRKLDGDGEGQDVL